MSGQWRALSLSLERAFLVCEFVDILHTNCSILGLVQYKRKYREVATEGVESAMEGAPSLSLK